MKNKIIIIIIILIVLSVTSCFKNKEYELIYINSIDNTVMSDRFVDEGYEAGPYYLFSLSGGYSGYMYKGTYTESGTLVTYENPIAVSSDTKLFVTYENLTFMKTLYETDDSEYIQNLYSTSENVFILTSNHRVLIYGNNKYSELGMNIDKYTNIPQDITSQISLSDGEYITDIKSNQFSVLFLSNFNKIYVLGYQSTQNDDFSYGKVTDITDYLELLPDETIINLSVGYGDYGILTSKHRVLLLDKEEDRSGHYLSVDDFVYGIKVTDITSEFQLLSGDYIQTIYFSNSNFAVSKEGKVFGWGFNLYGNLGNNVIDFNSDEFANAYKYQNDIYFEDKPVDITDNFQLKTNESISDIRCEGVYCLFLTNEHRLFLTGDCNIPGILNGEGLYSSNYTNIPLDITDHLLLHTGENIEKIYGTGNFSILVTNEFRQIGYNYPLDELSDVNQENTVIADITDYIPNKLLNVTRNISIYYFLDEDHHVYITGKTRVENIPYRDLLNLDPLDDDYYCNQVGTIYDTDFCQTTNGLLDITSYYPIGYKIISSEPFQYKKPWDITNKYYDIAYKQDLGSNDFYPAHNLFLISKE